MICSAAFSSPNTNLHRNRAAVAVGTIGFYAPRSAHSFLRRRLYPPTNIGNRSAEDPSRTEKAMPVKEYEHMLETEEERLSVHLFGTDYQRLCPDLREWVRG